MKLCDNCDRTSDNFSLEADPNDYAYYYKCLCGACFLEYEFDQLTNDKEEEDEN